MRTSVLLDYGGLMTDEEWAPETQHAGVRDDLRFRPPQWMGDALKTVALVEHNVRELQNKPGAISVNKMMEHIVERFLLGYQEKYGRLPGVLVEKQGKTGKEVREPDPVKSANYAAGVVARRKSEPSPKK